MTDTSALSLQPSSSQDGVSDEKAGAAPPVPQRSYSHATRERLSVASRSFRASKGIIVHDEAGDAPGDEKKAEVAPEQIEVKDHGDSRSSTTGACPMGGLHRPYNEYCTPLGTLFAVFLPVIGFACCIPMHRSKCGKCGQVFKRECSCFFTTCISCCPACVCSCCVVGPPGLSSPTAAKRSNEPGPTAMRAIEAHRAEQRRMTMLQNSQRELEKTFNEPIRE